MSEITQSGKARGRPERHIDWDGLDRLLDETCIHLGYGVRPDGSLDRSVGDKLLSERISSPGTKNALWRFRARRSGGPDWSLCWRLAEVSGIDLLRWYDACGFLPPHLTSYARPSEAAARAERDLARLRALTDLAGSEAAADAVFAAALRMARAGASAPTPPAPRRRTGRAGNR
jgi:hypothetical protein